LAKISSTKTQIFPWKELFKQFSVALVYSSNNDNVSDLVRIIYDFHKNNSDYVKVFSGMMNGCVLDTKNMWNIMHVPTLNHARAQLTNMLVSPMQNFSHITAFYAKCLIQDE
jgi:ribosomal protein L10